MPIKLKKELEPIDLPDTDYEAIDDELRTLKIAEEMAAVNLVIGERIGQMKTNRVYRYLATVTDLIAIQKIKQSKQYKGFKVIGEDGKSYSVTTFSEYCRYVEGRSVESVDLDLLNFKHLGEEAYEAFAAVGLGPAKMRKLRLVSADDEAEIRALATIDDKDELLEAAESMIERQAAEKAKIKRQRDEAEANLEASRQHNKEKDEKLNELEIINRRASFADTDWLDAVKPLMDQANEAARNIKFKLNQLQLVAEQTLQVGADAGDGIKELHDAREIVADTLRDIYQAAERHLDKSKEGFESGLGLVYPQQ